MYTTHPQPQHRPLALRRGVGDFVAMLLFLTALSLGAGMLGWSFWHMDRIYTGVSVAGVPVGGLSRAGAISKLSRELTPYPLQPVTLSDGQHSWTVTPAQIDVEVDLLGAVNQAFLLGRRDGLGQDPTGAVGRGGVSLTWAGGGVERGAGRVRGDVHVTARTKGAAPR